MDLQLPIVAITLTAALAYILRATYRTWAGRSTGCGSGCGKCAAPPPAEPAGGRRIALPMG